MHLLAGFVTAGIQNEGVTAFGHAVNYAWAEPQNIHGITIIIDNAFMFFVKSLN